MLEECWIKFLIVICSKVIERRKGKKYPTVKNDKNINNLKLLVEQVGDESTNPLSSPEIEIGYIATFEQRRNFISSGISKDRN